LFGKQFRIFGNTENPLFLAQDVAEWIDHSKASIMIDPVDDAEKLRETIFTSGQNREMWFLTEDGPYEVLMQSRKPIAKQFKTKVKEILKDIRKHGVYATDSFLDMSIADPEYAIGILQALKAAREEKAKLQIENREMKPKAIHYDHIYNSDDLVPITQIAKDYGKSGKWFNKYLNEKGIQYNINDSWVLYQDYADKGYVGSKTCDFQRRDGTYGAKMHTYWTQKGREFLYRLLKNDGIFPLIESSPAFLK